MDDAERKRPAVTGVFGWVLRRLGWRPRRFRRGSFVRDVFTLSSGTVGAQVLLVLCTPALTRLYDPAHFAVLALFTRCAGILSVLACGRYDFALMLQERDRDAANMAAVCVLLSSGLVLVLAGLLAVFGDSVLHVFGIGAGGGWSYFLPLAVLLISWDAMGSRWQARRKRFGRVAAARLAYAGGAVSAQMAGGFVSLLRPGLTLICGFLVGRILSAAVLVPAMARGLGRLRESLSVGRMKSLARQHWRFPVFSSASGVASRLTHALPYLLLAGYFPARAVGFYALSARALRLPMTLLGRATAEVFFQRVAAVRNDARRSRRFLLLVAGNLLCVGTPPMLAVLFLARPLFGFVFGSHWADAGAYAQRLVPVLLAQFVVAPTGLSMQAFEKQHIAFAWQIMYVLVSFGAFHLGRLQGGALEAVLFYSISAAAMYVVYFLLSLRFARGGPAPVGEDQ